jgi:hypothetical protein
LSVKHSDELHDALPHVPCRGVETQGRGAHSGSVRAIVIALPSKGLEVRRIVRVSLQLVHSLRKLLELRQDFRRSLDRAAGWWRMLVAIPLDVSSLDEPLPA